MTIGKIKSRNIKGRLAFRKSIKEAIRESRLISSLMINFKRMKINVLAITKRIKILNSFKNLSSKPKEKNQRND